MLPDVHVWVRLELCSVEETAREIKDHADAGLYVVGFTNTITHPMQWLINLSKSTDQTLQRKINTMSTWRTELLFSDAHTQERVDYISTIHQRGIHYRNPWLCRVLVALPSVVLGKDPFTERRTLGKKIHSAKMLLSKAKHSVALGKGPSAAVYD